MDVPSEWVTQRRILDGLLEARDDQALIIALRTLSMSPLSWLSAAWLIFSH